MTHVQKRKLVYNAYRDMLKNYNERANEILESKPPSSLTEDRGVADRIDSMILQQQQLQQEHGGGGGVGAPPPPPPPPPGQAGGMRLKTEIPAVRTEPPACVQNAMMTKDKKPFTYTPGGLDLSQIRSPRMARRLTRNANSEGVESVPSAPPPQTASVPPPQPASQPLLAPPPPPPPPQFPQAPPPSAQAPAPAPTPAPVKQTPPQTPQTPGGPRPAQVGTLYVPPLDSPVVMLNKAPTPWLTKGHQQQSEPQPAWVTGNKEPAKAPATQPQAQQSYTSSPQPYTPPTQVQTPQFTPTPPTPQQVHSPHFTPSPQYSPATPQYASAAPYFAAQPPQQAPGPQPSQGPATRVVPIQIERTPQYIAPSQGPPQHVINQQYGPQQGPPHHGPPQPQYHQAPPMAAPTPGPPQHGPVTRIIPIQMETDNGEQQPTGNFHPVQSPAFRVLQKMTSREDPTDQMRRLQLSEDDKALMNKVRAQVDEENFLHNEVDPRYRGAAIPSRAFRILQSMTDTDGTSEQYVRPANKVGNQQQQIRVQTEMRTQVPASEQQVPQEPRKYTGGAIPSRSFQMLQAMVAPENCGPGQSDL